MPICVVSEPSLMNTFPGDELFTFRCTVFDLRGRGKPARLVEEPYATLTKHFIANIYDSRFYFHFNAGRDVDSWNVYAPHVKLFTIILCALECLSPTTCPRPKATEMCSFCLWTVNANGFSSTLVRLSKGEIVAALKLWMLGNWWWRDWIIWFAISLISYSMLLIEVCEWKHSLNVYSFCNNLFQKTSYLHRHQNLIILRFLRT